MIIDRLDKWERYFRNSRRFSAAFNYLLNTIKNKVNDGCYKIEGNDLFANIDSYQTVNEHEKRFEAHRKYIDVQYIVKGTEAIYWLNVQDLTSETDYSYKDDIIFFNEADDCRLKLSEGFFVVFFPEDAHKPGCIWQKVENVQKIVLKIKI